MLRLVVVSRVTKFNAFGACIYDQGKRLIGGDVLPFDQIAQLIYDAFRSRPYASRHFVDRRWR